MSENATPRIVSFGCGLRRQDLARVCTEAASRPGVKRQTVTADPTTLHQYKIERRFQVVRLYLPGGCVDHILNPAR